MTWSTFDNQAAGPEQIESFASVLEALHSFHDSLAAAAPSPALLDELAADLQRWHAVLTASTVPELDRLSGRIALLPVRGHAAIPPFVVEASSPDRVEGVVTFGPFFLGGGAAVHGGVLTMLFDEVLGILASSDGRAAARTAYLKVDFRTPVPINEPVRLRAWFDRVEGRKRYLRGEMLLGATLCAEADGLFVELRDSGS